MSSYKATRNKLMRRAVEKRVPMLGEFELTPRCNLNCTMCFVRDMLAHDELSTTQWKTLFDQAVDAGLLFATLTGGEVFMREDFTELYTYLYDKGVRITVFTNGTLLNDTVLDTLITRPPEFVSITLYGASNQTYETITRTKQGFDKVDQSIDALMRANIHVSLKTIPIQATYKELDAIMEYIQSKNLTMNYFLYVGKTRDHRLHPLNDRLSPTELSDFEARIKTRFDYPEDETYEHTNGAEGAFMCAALKGAYFINWKGMMLPCAMVDHPTQKVGDDLKDTFAQLGKIFNAIELYDKCKTCDLNAQCIQCYARRYLEGNSQSCPDYLRAFALKRGKSDGQT